ncbi:MAG TPA: PEP-CTERM system histidine kinase PrsK, partial [Gammaproteobacteria bacterium]|nr:PEP-CTERM system histidine kinase PrsK [Gammaproteobacteria bacterium]
SLWVKTNKQSYGVITQMNMEELNGVLQSEKSNLTAYLENWQWVINLSEYQTDPALYQGLTLPEWLQDQQDAWLVVPLMLQAKLYGFVVILRPRAEKEFNWEDIDLLKTAGRQVAIHLAQQRSALALAQARQFEAFNRFSAYVVHDLKNLVSQLALVVKNAEKHKHNPAFMDDAIKTVDNSVDRMNRLLAQLRSGTIENSEKKTCRLTEALNAVIAEKSHGKPKPVLRIESDDLSVNGDEARLVSIIGHIVQNAQDATADDGEITVTLKKKGNQALIIVQDTGCGMDQVFIEERLFKPFDSTKGLTGMGIGAHESRSYIEELGGSLNVFSELNKGSIFHILLPLALSNGG